MFSMTSLPPLVLSKGLTPTRQWYLYKKLWDCCEDGLLPLVPKPASSARNSPEPDDEPTLIPALGATVEIEPSRKRRLCSLCGETGHNRRTCSLEKL